jgi:hypothetical protein
MTVHGLPRIIKMEIGKGGRFCFSVGLMPFISKRLWMGKRAANELTPRQHRIGFIDVHSSDESH